MYCGVNGMSLRAWTALALLCLTPGRAAPTPPGNACAVCHSEIEVKFRASAHHRPELSCTSCHGGNDSVLTVRGGHDKSFRGTPDRLEIPSFCAECHADVTRMRPFGLPIDQLAMYQTSAHGRGLEAGNKRVAVCTDCHGTHEILEKSDPKSPIHPRNLARTCGSCHGDAQLMGQAGLSVDVIKQYAASVHAEALTTRGPEGAPDCVSCHGSHGAMPPGTGNESTVCAQCHKQTMEYFRSSPHRGPRSGDHRAECTDCHGNHRVQVATAMLWQVPCKDCHDAGSDATRVGEKIAAVIAEAEEEVQNAEQAVARARKVPLDVTDYEARISTATSHLVELRPLGHSLEMEAIELAARRSRSIAKEVQAEIHEQLRVFEGRKLIVILVWLYILITVAAVQLYKRHAR